MSLATWFREIMHREPIVAFSCVISAVGLSMPLIGIPIRDYINSPTPKSPPPIKELIRREKPE